MTNGYKGAGDPSGRHNGDRSPDEIVADLDHTRARMDADLEALQDRLSPGYLMDEALRYMREGGAAEYFRNLGETAKRNPMPLALVTTGLAWLAFSSGRGESGGASSESRHRRSTDVESEYSDYPGAYVQGSGDLYASDEDVDLLIATEYEEPVGTQGGTGQRAREKAASVAQGARGKAQEARERAGAAVQSAKNRMHGVAESARHSVQSAREGTRRRAESARRQAQRARQGTSRFIHDQPLAAAGIALTVGAIIGGLLPSTRREDRLMGASSDKLKRSAEESAASVAERGRQVAESGIEGARRGAESSSTSRPGAPGNPSVSPRSQEPLESLGEGEERSGRMSAESVVESTGAKGTESPRGGETGKPRR